MTRFQVTELILLSFTCDQSSSFPEIWFLEVYSFPGICSPKEGCVERSCAEKIPILFLLFLKGIKARNDQRHGAAAHPVVHEDFMDHLTNTLGSSAMDLPEGARAPKVSTAARTLSQSRCRAAYFFFLKKNCKSDQVGDVSSHQGHTFGTCRLGT